MEQRCAAIRKSDKQAEANVIRSKKNVEMVELDLGYTVITTPYSGYMGRRTLEVGQFVQKGQTLTYLVRSDEKWITANFKETQIAHIHIGQRVYITVDAFPDRQFEGVVSEISEATGSKYALVPIDNSAGNFVKCSKGYPCVLI